MLFNSYVRKLGQMCCVFGCEFIYRTQKNDSDKTDYISVYNFPVNGAEKQSWIPNVPNCNAVIPKGKQIAVCCKH